MAWKVRVKGLNSQTKGPLKRLETIYEKFEEAGSSRASNSSVKDKKRRRKLFGRPCRIRAPRLHISRLLSPLTLLKKLRDGYVRMMWSLEARGACSYGGLVYGHHMVHPTVVPGRIVDRRNEEQEIRIASLLTTQTGGL